MKNALIAAVVAAIVAAGSANAAYRPHQQQPVGNGGTLSCWWVVTSPLPQQPALRFTTLSGALNAEKTLLTERPNVAVTVQRFCIVRPQ